MDHTKYFDEMLEGPSYGSLEYEKELVQLPSSSWGSFAEWSRDPGGRAPLAESKRNTKSPLERERGVEGHILQLCHSKPATVGTGHSTQKVRNASVMRRGDPKLEMLRCYRTEKSMIVPGRLSLIGSHLNDFH